MNTYPNNIPALPPHSEARVIALQEKKGELRRGLTIYSGIEGALYVDQNLSFCLTEQGNMLSSVIWVSIH